MVVHFSKGCVKLYEISGKTYTKLHEGKNLHETQKFIDSKFRS